MARKVMKQEVGTIYQKPSGTYYYRYQINGERKAISLKTKNQEEAKKGKKNKKQLGLIITSFKYRFCVYGSY